ncbi:MAG: hypothetical protein QXG00_07690 [Candidatus Woesearchaeota archaeon]
MLSYNVKQIKKFLISLSFLFLFTESTIGQESLEKDNLIKYSNTLQSLKDTNAESILTAKEKYYAFFRNNDKNAEQGFRMFREFYNKVIYAINEKSFIKISNVIFEEPEFHRVLTGTFDNPLSGFEKLNKIAKDRIKKKYSNQLKDITKYIKCGIKISGDDVDGYYLDENFDFLIDMTQNYQFDLAEFIRFMKEEVSPIQIDAGLQISWEELRKKIIRFETFARKYPNLQETTKEIEPNLKWFLSIYLAGLDNSPVFDWESNKLDNELKKSYETFLKENKASSYYSVIKELYDIYKKYNFQDNGEARKFIYNLNLYE